MKFIDIQKTYLFQSKILSDIYQAKKVKGYQVDPLWYSSNISGDYSHGQIKLNIISI